VTFEPPADDLETGTRLTPRFGSDGLVTTITVDADSGEVLMLAHMSALALHRTLKDGVATYWSRSRNELWVKGQESGHTQRVVEVRVDCDQDAVLLRVRQQGGACHAGYHSCFYRRVDGGRLVTDQKPEFDPAAVYGSTE